MTSWAVISSSTKPGLRERVEVAGEAVAAVADSAAAGVAGEEAVEVAVAAVVGAGTATAAIVAVAATAAGKCLQHLRLTRKPGSIGLPGFVLRHKNPAARSGLADVLCEGPVPTLHVKNIPRDVYAALRRRAMSNQRSIVAEVRALLKEYVPTARELKARHKWVRKLVRLRASPPKSRGLFPSAEEMIREDRER